MALDHLAAARPSKNLVIIIYDCIRGVSVSRQLTFKTIMLFPGSLYFSTIIIPRMTFDPGNEANNAYNVCINYTIIIMYVYIHDIVVLVSK